MKISLVFFSIFISSLIGEINKPLIEVRLNTSATSTSIEWIPFANNYEISISEFWNYMGDSERGEKAQQYIDYKKSKLSYIKWLALPVSLSTILGGIGGDRDYYMRYKFEALAALTIFGLVIMILFHKNESNAVIHPPNGKLSKRTSDKYIILW